MTDTANITETKTTFYKLKSRPDREFKTVGSAIYHWFYYGGSSDCEKIDSIEALTEILKDEITLCEQTKWTAETTLVTLEEKIVRLEETKEEVAPDKGMRKGWFKRKKND